jgi:hypothetical protein
MRDIILLVLVSAGMSVAQTQIDLRNQVQSATKPVKVGPVLPVGCTTGDLFLNTNAPVGGNLFGCVATNTWALQAGAVGNSILVQGDGVAIGSKPIQNFQSGPGILTVLADTGSRIDVSHQVDTTIVQTRANAQSGADTLCVSAATTGNAYACTVLPILPNYTAGMVLYWIPDVSSDGDPVTLQVDALDAVPVTLLDGLSDPAAGDIAAGELTPVWYDGAQFRLLGARGTLANAARPDCGPGVRGRLWYQAGASGVKDDVAVCAKDAADGFGWRVVY